MGLGSFLNSLFGDEPQEPRQPQSTRRVYVDQSNSTIGVKAVNSLIVGQIGGTINNNAPAQPEAPKDTGKTPENSRAIGVVNWEDYGL